MKKLKAVRLNMGMSQITLADIARVNRETINLHETGLRMMTAEEQLRIGDVLDVSSEALFPCEEWMNEPPFPAIGGSRSDALEGPPIYSKNTTNSPQPTSVQPYRRTVCWNARPCYRRNCEYCNQRRRPLRLQQIAHYGGLWGWNQMYTISFPGWRGSLVDAYTGLRIVRAGLTKSIARRSNYLAVIAVGGVERSLETLTPHIHLLCKSIKRSEITNLVKRLHALEPVVHLREINSAIELRNVAGYLLDQNYWPGQLNRPPYFRLMTATRPLHLGKPRRLQFPLGWKGHE